MCEFTFGLPKNHCQFSFVFVHDYDNFHASSITSLVPHVVCIYSIRYRGPLFVIQQHRVAQ